MPTNVVAIENSKKHLTPQEISARKKAQDAMKRKAVKIRPPITVKEAPEALKYWKKIIKDLKGIDLLDNLDGDMLALYCLGMARLAEMRKDYAEFPDLKLIGPIQAQERILLSYAKELGLTPAGRARLAVKQAKTKEKDANEDLYGD